jgi:hypothetical protein
MSPAVGFHDQNMPPHVAAETAPVDVLLRGTVRAAVVRAMLALGEAGGSLDNIFATVRAQAECDLSAHSDARGQVAEVLRNEPKLIVASNAGNNGSVRRHIHAEGSIKHGTEFHHWQDTMLVLRVR